MSSDREELRLRLLAFIQSEGRDGDFDALALDLFAFQFANCPPFRELCRFRGIGDPRAIAGLDAIPRVPTDTFKLYRIACFPPSASGIRFETSGTTQGRPGVHVMRDTGLYDAGAMLQFRAALLADGAPRRFLSLTGSPRTMPRSSLVHMIDTAARGFGLGGEAAYFFTGNSLDFDRFQAAISSAHESGHAVVILTTAFALVHAIEEAGARGIRLPLPPHSRVMETGGYKGRSRELSVTELYDRAASLFAIDPAAIVNEYGMTEMSSQFYDRTGPDGAIDPVSERIKVPPPWVRTTVLRPATLTPARPGEIGMLAHIDLANLDSCAFLLTADAALAAGDGFILLGRLSGGELRGCSLAYEEPVR